MNSLLLKKKLKIVQIELQEKDTIRLHRAISWVKCAEESDDNKDIQFISLWIAFNSCYAININKDNLLTEKDRFRDFIVKLVKFDSEQRFYNLLWNKFSDTVRLLLQNQYLFKPFWDYQSGETKEWKRAYEKSLEDSMKYLSNNKVVELLEVVLDRLYILRNQLIHGGATYKSKINRIQLRDSCNMLNLFVPLIIEIMLANKNEDWGKINYPVVS